MDVSHCVRHLPCLLFPVCGIFGKQIVREEVDRQSEAGQQADRDSKTWVERTTSAFRHIPSFATMRTSAGESMRSVEQRYAKQTASKKKGGQAKRRTRSVMVKGPAVEFDREVRRQSALNSKAMKQADVISC